MVHLVRQELVANPAITVLMGNQVRKVHLVQLGNQVLLVSMGTMVSRVQLVHQVPRAHLASLALQVPKVLVDRRANAVMMGTWDHVDQWASKARPVLLVILVTRASLVHMAKQVYLEIPGLLANRDLTVIPANQDPSDRPVGQAHQEIRANLVRWGHGDSLACLGSLVIMASPVPRVILDLWESLVQTESPVRRVSTASRVLRVLQVRRGWPASQVQMVCQA